MTKYTPGPWRVVDGSEYIMRLYDGERPGYIARMLGRSDELEANTRLIAAAPDMLDALRSITRAQDLEEAVNLAYRFAGMWEGE